MHIYVQRASRALLIAAIAASSAACATITRGSKEDWAVQTDPAGATVKTSTGFTCDATPCTLKLPRKTEFDVTISKPGYKTVEARVTNAMSGAGTAGMVGNVVLGGVLGIGIDAVSGAALDLNPNPLVVKLELDGPAPTEEAATAVDAPAAATTADAAP